MIVECGHCGAPLDINETATIFKCKYCNAANERARVRTVAERTPKGFTPPKKWTPPPQFSADSNKELSYGNKIGTFIIVAVVALPLVIIFIVWMSERTGIGGTSASALAKLTALDGTPNALGQTLGGEAHDTSMWVQLSSDRYKTLSLSWDANHLDHPTSFALLGRREKAPCDPQLLTKLGAALRGGLDDDNGWRWEQVGLSCGKDGTVSAYVRIDDNGVWKQQLDVAWKLVLGAAFGVDVAPTRTEMLDLMGAGYPFASLETFSPLTKVDAAQDVVKKQFPGAVFDTHGGITATIPIDHPLFRSVSLEWMNSRDATIRSARFDPLSTKVFTASREAFVTCLSKTLGPARVTDADFIKKTKSYSWSPGSLSVNLGESNFGLTFGGSPWQPTADPIGYTNVMRTIGSCRGL